MLNKHYWWGNSNVAIATMLARFTLKSILWIKNQTRLTSKICIVWTMSKLANIWEIVNMFKLNAHSNVWRKYSNSILRTISKFAPIIKCNARLVKYYSFDQKYLVTTAYKHLSNTTISSRNKWKKMMIRLRFFTNLASTLLSLGLGVLNVITTITIKIFKCRLPKEILTKLAKLNAMLVQREMNSLTIMSFTTDVSSVKISTCVATVPWYSQASLTGR